MLTSTVWLRASRVSGVGCEPLRFATGARATGCARVVPCVGTRHTIARTAVAP